MTVDLEQVLTALVQLTLVGGGIGGLYLGIKKWVKDISGATAKAAQQLETTNGHTVGQYVEQMAADVDELKGMSRDNRTRIEVLESWRNEHTRGHP